MSPRDHAQDLPESTTRPATTGTAPIAPPPLWLLVAMTGIGPFAMQILIPGLPLMARDLDVPYGIAQLTLTLYLTGVAIGQLLYGPLSDRFGRRPVLLWAIGAFLAASALAALAPGMGWLLLARVAQAAGACSGMVLGRAIVRDVWPREEAASRIGYVVMGMTIAPMVSPMLGAVLEGWFGWRATMVACVVLGAPVLLAVWRHLPETLRAPQPLPGVVGMLAAYGSLLRLPAFRWIAAVGAANSASFFVFMAGAPLVSVAMGSAPHDYAAAFLIVSVAFAAGSWLAGRFSARLGLANMLTAGLLVGVAGGLGMVLVVLLAPPSLTLFFLPMAVVALGNGISLPNAVAAAISVRPERAGTASGLLGASQMGFGAVMTVVVGALEGGRGLATGLAMLACGAVAVLALRGARRHL